MAKWRKKPVVIEAEQWFPNKDIDGVCYCNESPSPHNPHIHTLEGPHLISVGDYIITGVKGERYPCKPDIFLLTYEPA